MAKTVKFSDDLLLEAVVKYSEECPRTIKATELAEWANDNIDGLQGVRYYHFTRKVIIEDRKTGEKKEIEKECTKKIKEINERRSIKKKLDKNVLFSAGSLEDFFDLPIFKQKKNIEESRSMVRELIRKNTYLSYNEARLRSENKALRETKLELENKIKNILIKQNKIEKKLNYYKKMIENEDRKELLKEIGISDGVIDLDQYNKSINENLEEIYDINSEIKKFYKSNEKDSNDLIDKIMDGLD